MCRICDGMTYDESMERMREHIRERSWTVQGVEASGHGRPWAYTVGLVEHYGHPELVITDGDLESSAVLLGSVAAWIEEGDRYGPGDIVPGEGCAVEFGPVHPSYLRHGLCAMWTAYYEFVGRDPGPLEVLNVMTSSPSTCVHQRARARDLEVVGAFDRPVGPNRAARRRAVRRR